MFSLSLYHMKQFLTIMLILGGSLPLLGQNLLDEEGRKTGPWKVDYPDGNTRYTTTFVNGHPSGEMIRYYPDGSVQAKMDFSPDGTKSYTRLYQFEKIVAEGWYIQQAKDSVWTYYSAIDRTVRIRESYSQGKLDGPVRNYYPEGGVSEEVLWKEGSREGSWQQYYTDGNIRLCGNYKNNLLEGDYKIYHSNEEVKIKGTYLEGLAEGLWYFFDEEGREIYALEYSRGQPADMEKYEAWVSDTLEKYQNRNLPEPDEDF